MMGLPQAVESSSVVGTGILRLVTTAMYDNPLAVYREYNQNSTDAIAGMADSTKGKVEISIDPSERRVKIWDNGPGVSNDDAPQQLVPIGRSNKQMGSDRGFRGIGRPPLAPSGAGGWAGPRLSVCAVEAWQKRSQSTALVPLLWEGRDPIPVWLMPREIRVPVGAPASPVLMCLLFSLPSTSPAR